MTGYVGPGISGEVSAMLARQRKELKEILEKQIELAGPS
jgi:hypothetical protein